jgi:hypothetical protein
MAFKLSEKIGEKYRIQTDKGGFLRQMGPRKLSKDRAEYRLALLNGEEPYDYVNDETSPETSAANQAAIDNYIASQSASKAKYEASSSASQAVYNSCSQSLAELDELYHADPPQIDQATYEASSSVLLTSMSKAETTMSRCAASMSKCDTNIENAASNAPATTITEVPATLVLDNTPKKGYKIEADFTANEVTIIEANEKVEGGISIKNTGDEPANLVINVGNSDVTLATNSEWDTVTVESVADDTLTVATYTHIKKLVVKKGRVWVNNALVEDCVDEVVVEGGKVEANPEIVNPTKSSQFISKPSVVKVGNDLSIGNLVYGIIASGHYVWENNANIEMTSKTSAIMTRGSVDLELKGAGTWRCPANPLVWAASEKSKIRIYDGKFFNGNYAECIYAELGTIEIFGGEFHNVPEEGQKNFLLNCKDANYKAGKANIVVYGGKFYGFDPAANAAESADMTTNFVAEGYKSVYNEEGDYYEVVKDE